MNYSPAFLGLKKKKKKDPDFQKSMDQDFLIQKHHFVYLLYNRVYATFSEMLKMLFKPEMGMIMMVIVLELNFPEEMVQEEEWVLPVVEAGGLQPGDRNIEL